ncbi:MAG TPA: hypothetical protein IAB85_04085, partial [Candidatus Coprenecus merdigallinarum]|nr:hypothetical protein [Candidatus Coprenecus merdigallinarum]
PFGLCLTAAEKYCAGPGCAHYFNILPTLKIPHPQIEERDYAKRLLRQIL